MRTNLKNLKKQLDDLDRANKAAVVQTVSFSFTFLVLNLFFSWGGGDFIFYCLDSKCFTFMTIYYMFTFQWLIYSQMKFEKLVLM